MKVEDFLNGLVPFSKAARTDIQVEIINFIGAENIGQVKIRNGTMDSAPDEALLNMQVEYGIFPDTKNVSVWVM